MVLRVLRIIVLVAITAFTGSAKADLIYTLQIDATRSFAEAQTGSHTASGPYAISGWLQLTQYADSSLSWFDWDFRVTSLELHTGSLLRPFRLINAPGQVSGDHINFLQAGCAFWIGPGSCMAFPDRTSTATGTFDGTALFLDGNDLAPNFEIGANPTTFTDYSFRVYATVADFSPATPGASTSAVPEPATLLLLFLAGAALLLTRTYSLARCG